MFQVLVKNNLFRQFVHISVYTDFDAEKALKACVATANLDNYRGIGLYKKLGYIPYNIKDEYNADNWSLSKTLEYAFDDYCIAEMARKMGKTELAEEFYKRSQNYKNVFNPATGFMQPVDDKGVLSGLSVPMTIQPIFARVTDGSIYGLCLRIFAD